MATFVHLACEKTIKSLLKNGIKPGRKFRSGDGHVYAVPVTPDFYTTHQWLRELRRGGERTLCAVYFRLHHSEIVSVGHYNRPHQTLTAAQAVALFRSPNWGGYEVLIPRKIHQREIIKVRHLKQITGWRYCPDAHERLFCGCVMCVPPGSIRARQKNAQWEAKQNGD